MHSTRYFGHVWLWRYGFNSTRVPLHTNSFSAHAESIYVLDIGMYCRYWHQKSALVRMGAQGVSTQISQIFPKLEQYTLDDGICLWYHM